MMSFRLPRTFQASLPNLRRRALFLAGGIVVGLLAVLMAWLADRAQIGFRAIDAAFWWAPILVTPAGFALSAFATRRFFPGAQGSGIPQVIAARRLERPEDRATLVSLRVGLGKIALLVFGLLCGASSGREGPTVQVGAATMFLLGRIEPHRQPGLLLAGSAAGIAAAFNAPLAGIIFGIEEMSRSFEQRSSVLVLATVIAAGLTSQALMGDYTYFGVAHGGMPKAWQWLAIPLCVVVCGVLGGLFSRTVVAFARGLRGRAGRLISTHPVLLAAICGLIVAACGVLTGGAVFGTGYDQAQAVLNGQSVPWAFGPAKLLATAASAISGIPGGIFSPSLAVGAGLGFDLAPLVPGMPIDTLAILCMAGFLAGVVQAPLTSAVIVSEMTADHTLIFPIMICALGASAVARLISPEGIYHQLANLLLASRRPPSTHDDAAPAESPNSP